MRVIITGQRDPSTWSLSYVSAVLDALQSRGHEAEFVGTYGAEYGDDSVAAAVSRVLARDPDVVLASMTEDIVPYHLAKEGVCVVAHHHGGPEGHSLVNLAAPNDFLAWALHEYNEVMVNTESSRHEVAEAYGVAAIVVGFPIRSPPASGASKDIVLVPGRLGGSKQTMLAAEALVPWAGKVVFSTAEAPTPRLESYKRALERLGYACKLSCRGADYDLLLSRAAVVVSTSLSETLGTACYEACLAGAVGVFPSLGVFRELYKGPFYLPYSVASIQHRVGDALWVRVGSKPRNPRWYTPKAVTGRIIKLLEDCHAG